MVNRLADESSPYLKQHAKNTVDWYPWEEEAFFKAREENKPIHLSIGYAACHWCHVMAHESYENEEVANALNKHFVNIKVDRQERPDIDDVYQKVVQMQGQPGGWPLTVFMTADKKPFFGGTYFPPHDRYGLPGFLHLISAISHAWRNDRDKLEENINGYMQGYQFFENPPASANPTTVDDLPLTVAQALAKRTDSVYGGLGTKPKFPNPLCYDLLLRVYHRTKDSSLLDPLILTLNKMWEGGLYDHLGGGFSRYCVDQQWAIPHFEKMLYDNALLVKLYADAYRLTGDTRWRHIVDHTIEYVVRNLTHTDGGFYSSEDADSEGEEGKYYVWTPAQIKEVLGEEDGEFACYAYGVTEQGNFEHGTTVLSRRIQLTTEEENKLSILRSRLLKARAQRTRPSRDDNIITSWNALIIQGLCAAYQATGRANYLLHAKHAAKFIKNKLTMPNGVLFRIWNNGEASIPGFLEDYSFLANAYLDLYECTFEKKYLNQAMKLVDLINDKFWDNGFYFTSHVSEKLIYRPRAPFDNALPSGISTSVFALLRLFALTGDNHYDERADHVLKTYQSYALSEPFSFAHLIAAQEFVERNPYIIMFAGDKNDLWQLAGSVYRSYLPHRVLAIASDVPAGKGKDTIGGQATAYVCRYQTCFPPVTNHSDLMQLIINGK